MDKEIEVQRLPLRSLNVAASEVHLAQDSERGLKKVKSSILPTPNDQELLGNFYATKSSLELSEAK